MDLSGYLHLIILTVGISASLFLIFIIIIKIIRNETASLMEALYEYAVNVEESLSAHEKQISERIGAQVEKLEKIFGSNNDFLNEFVTSAGTEVEKIFTGNISMMNEQISAAKQEILDFITGIQESLNSQLADEKTGIEKILDEKTSQLSDTFRLEAGIFHKNLRIFNQRPYSPSKKFHNPGNYTFHAGKKYDGSYITPEYDPKIISLIEKMLRQGKSNEYILDKLSIDEKQLKLIIDEMNPLADEKK